MFSNNTIGAQSECDIIYVDYIYNVVFLVDIFRIIPYIGIFSLYSGALVS